jgi:hypothetical protein
MIPLALALVLVGCAPRGEDHACTDVTFFADADGDGHGDPSATIAACAAPDGYTTASDDCDDGNAEVQQGTVWYVDGDADGFGDPATGAYACESPPDRIAVGEDCDDTNIAIHPDAEELCNTTDDDCDGSIDEEPIDGTTFYADADGDGLGNASVDVVACAQPSGYVAEATDCDDGDATVGAAQGYYYDHDADGYGDGEATSTCSPAANQVLLDGDCRPLNPDFNPGAPEACNSEDDNCDGLVDEDDPLLVGTTYYADDDGDGFGDPTDAHVWCDATDGYVIVPASDCDDTNFAIRPGAREYCDGIDNDCDGTVDDSPVYVDWYADDDGDGYGDPDDTVSDCGPLLTGYVLSQGDCDDTVATTHTGSSEVCANDADDDCDGETDNCVLNYGDLDAFVSGDAPDFGDRLVIADVNGDEVADLVGSDGTDFWELASVFVAVGPVTTDIGWGKLLRLQETTDDSEFGSAVGSGDMNVDDVDDILAGAPGTERAYLFLGPITAARAPADADAVLEADSAGSDVDAVDFDADGDPDMAVGACCDSTYAGAVYLASGPVSADVDLVADATWVFEGPSADDRVGDQVVDAGDVNGDGIHDLAIAADSGNGTVYVVDGGIAAGAYTIDLVASVVIAGPDLDSHFGSGLATPDYDGDGTIDFVVGAFQANASSTEQRGGVYGFLGPLSGALDVSDADATWLADVGSGVEWLGMGVAAGDIDADGSTDLALGAPDGSPAGSVYVQFGLASGTVDVTTLPSIRGESGDLPGASIVLAPDCTGDGGAEVVFGMPGYYVEDTGPGGGYGVLSSEELY